MKKGVRLMKINDWINKTNTKFNVVSHDNVSDLLLYFAPQDLGAIGREQLLKEFYATYVFNTGSDIIIASSVDGKNFSNMCYLNGSIAYLQRKSGENISMIDANLEFIKSTSDRKNIKNWEAFYLDKFLSDKYSLKDTPKEIIDAYISLNTELNIANITEGVVPNDEFHSFYAVASKDDKRPAVITVLGSKDGKNITSHFSLQYNKNLAPEEYENILTNLNLPSLENNF